MRVCKALILHPGAKISHPYLDVTRVSLPPGPFSGCAQKHELHGGDNIIPHIEAKLLFFRVSYRPVSPSQYVWFDKGLEIWYFLDHVGDRLHIV